MKNWRRVFELTFLVALFYVCLFVLPALAVRMGDDSTDREGTEVFVLDELQYDMRNLDIAYTVLSGCMRAEHETSLDYELDRRGRNVMGMRVIVMDFAPEKDCIGRKKETNVTARLDFETWFNGVSNDIKRQGYSFDPQFVLHFPSLRSPLPGTGDYYGDDTSGYPATPPAPVPTKVAVTVIQYTPGFQCTLYKSDGSRDDGFVGNGSTMDEARRDAATSCMRTSNPNCTAFSVDPAHTTCDIAYTATETVKEYDSNNLPEGANTRSWACTMYKKDGSRKDGFTGSGTTETEARSNVEAMCKATKHPSCSVFAYDDSHTTCTPDIRYEMPKPAYQWVCTLYKNDGSRKDGFRGTGANELDARRAAAATCRGTSNPYCDTFSMDPTHTNCTAEFEQQ